MNFYEKQEVEIVEFLSEVGEATPSMFDERFLEPIHNPFEILTNIFKWRDSPYPHALTNLVDKGMVRFWRDGDGRCWYALVSAEDKEEAIDP